VPTLVRPPFQMAPTRRRVVSEKMGTYVFIYSYSPPTSEILSLCRVFSRISSDVRESVRQTASGLTTFLLRAMIYLMWDEPRFSAKWTEIPKK